MTEMDYANGIIDPKYLSEPGNISAVIPGCRYRPRGLVDVVMFHNRIGPRILLSAASFPALLDPRIYAGSSPIVSLVYRSTSSRVLRKGM